MTSGGSLMPFAAADGAFFMWDGASYERQITERGIVAGTFQKLVFTMDQSPGASESVQFLLQRNGVDTALIATITAASQSTPSGGRVVLATGSEAYSDLDLAVIRVVPTAGAATAIYGWQGVILLP